MYSFFSLDVEGLEFEILKTIPFDKLDIHVMSVEFKHNPQGKEELLRYVESKGYKMVNEVHAEHNWANDFIFVKQYPKAKHKKL